MIVMVVCFCFVLIVLPIFSFIIEQYIVAHKASVIRDAVDIAALSSVSSFDAEELGRDTVAADYSLLEDVFINILMLNLNLDSELFPKDNSIASDKVEIDSLFLCSHEGDCYDEIISERPIVKSVVNVPINPVFLRKILLKAGGIDHYILRVTVITEIPVDK